MLVKDCMTRHPIMIPQTMPAAEAQKIMSENKVGYLPVVGDGKCLLGLITRQCLALKSDILGSLNVWEITRRLANLKIPNRTAAEVKRVLSQIPDQEIVDLREIV